MTVETPESALPLARQNLQDAVSALIDPQPVQLDHGRRTFLDPLYRQLSDAVAGQSGTRSGGASTIPIWADCWDLLQKIDGTVRGWLSEPSDTVARLQTLAATPFRPQDAPQLQQWASDVDRWVTKADGLLNPQPLVPLPGACPICGAESVEVVIAGELGHRHTLSVSLDGARCAACSRLWQTLPELRVLGRMLGHPDMDIA